MQRSAARLRRFEFPPSAGPLSRVIFQHIYLRVIIMDAYLEHGLTVWSRLNPGSGIREIVEAQALHRR